MDSFSVVIPCYNGSAFLKETLESALNQTHPPLEVIVIDDGSTDDSAAIAESFGPPVRVIRQENQGESVARNKGIKESNGDWVALLDADDYWKPNKLEEQVSLINSLPSDFVCVLTNVFSFSNDLTKEEPLTLEKHFDSSNYGVEMLCHTTVHPSSALIRSDIGKRIRFPEWTRHSEDIIFFLELRNEGKFARIEDHLTGYRRSPEQQTNLPHHAALSVISRLAWLAQSHSSYSEIQINELHTRLGEKLCTAHDWAFWKRDFDIVRLCREKIMELDNTSLQDHPLLQKKIYRREFYYIKDFIDKMMHLK